MQVRVARPTRDLERAAAFYRLLELPVIASFEDHAGYSGVVFGLPDASRQLELVALVDETPAPTGEDQLVLYLGSVETVARAVERIRSAGSSRRRPRTPTGRRTAPSASSIPTATG